MENAHGEYAVNNCLHFSLGVSKDSSFCCPTNPLVQLFVRTAKVTHPPLYVATKMTSANCPEDWPNLPPM